MSNIKIQSLTELSCSGVYIVLNASKKRVYIGFGVNMLNSVTRLLGDLKTNKALAEMSSDAEFLEIFVAEKIAPDSVLETSLPGYLRVRMKYWSGEYKKRGFTLYRSYEGMTYKTKTVLDISGRVVVMLTRPGCKPIVVGVFKRAFDAKVFVDREYKGKLIEAPVFCKNELTREWNLKHGA
tara:strand:+ start:4377 stop:4919 length:543 start_codon:yes stop_codon:yes gene_type:complete